MPTKSTQPADTKTSSASGAPATRGDPTIGLICIGMMALVLGLCIWGVLRALGRRRQRGEEAQPTGQRPQAAIDKPPGKKFFEKEMEAYRYGDCTTCTVRIRPGDRIFWDKYDKRARHTDCLGAIARDDAKEAKERDGKQAAALAKLLDRLASARGPAARRAIVERAKLVELTEEQRLQVLLEAAAIEVDAAIDKAGELKSAQARRRGLQEALALIKADEVPDEMQAEQIRILEQALQELESEPPT
jgi:hypothetical protein